MRRAVSADMDLWCLMMAFMRTGGTPIVLANRYWEIPSSSMISDSCSPGWIGSGLVIALFLSVIVDDFDLHRALVSPDEANTPLVVDSDAVLSCITSIVQ